MRTFDDYCYSRSFKFGHVLCPLDLRPHFHIHYFVLHLCDARKPAYYWCGVHGMYRINAPSFFKSQRNLFKQAIALFNMIRSKPLDLCFRKKIINRFMLELRLTSFRLGLCKFSRFIFFNSFMFSFQ